MSNELYKSFRHFINDQQWYFCVRFFERIASVRFHRKNKAYVLYLYIQTGDKVANIFDCCKKVICIQRTALKYAIWRWHPK